VNLIHTMSVMQTHLDHGDTHEPRTHQRHDGPGREADVSHARERCLMCAREALVGPTSERTVPVDVDAILRDHPELFEEEATLEAAQKFASATRAKANKQHLCERHARP